MVEFQSAEISEKIRFVSLTTSRDVEIRAKFIYIENF
jgi:hypothetical protein